MNPQTTPNQITSRDEAKRDAMRREITEARTGESEANPSRSESELLKLRLECSEKESILGEIERVHECSGADCRICEALMGDVCPHDETDHGICLSCGEDRDVNSHTFGKRPPTPTKPADSGADEMPEEGTKESGWMPLPNEQGDWWHWTGDEDSLPYHVHIFFSGTSCAYFATIGQYGWDEPRYPLDMGGLWKRCDAPALPGREPQPAQPVGAHTPEPLLWRCKRCKSIVDMVAKRCQCVTSPSPWEPIISDSMEQITARRDEASRQLLELSEELESEVVKNAQQQHEIKELGSKLAAQLNPSAVADVIAALEKAKQAMHWHGWHTVVSVPDRDSLEAMASNAVDAALAAIRESKKEML